jgi:hypothetical protein
MQLDNTPLKIHNSQHKIKGGMLLFCLYPPSKISNGRIRLTALRLRDLIEPQKAVRMT